MYYLQSRYYDPHTGRFLNADASLYGGLLGCNLFAYCGNNPVCYIDPTGENGVSGVLTWWASTMWGPALAEPTFIGEIIYVAGFTILGGLTVCLTNKSVRVFQDAAKKSSKEKGNQDHPNNEEEKPNIDYPGDDPTIAPGDDYSWYGQQPIGGDKGAWVNIKTGEQLHPDLNHPLPKGPHWDYTRIVNGVKETWSLFKNGRVVIWK